jgi:hypothetical protein
VYRGSSEIAILVKGHDQALALRKLLAAEHLGYKDPRNAPDDFNQLFDSFYQCASENGELRIGNSLNGQLVFHRAGWW